MDPDSRAARDSPLTAGGVKKTRLFKTVDEQGMEPGPSEAHSAVTPPSEAQDSQSPSPHKVVKILDQNFPSGAFLQL